MSNTNASYKELCNRIEEVMHISHAISMLHWDMRTYMPRGGIEKRSQEVAILAKVAHDKLTDPRIGNLLNECRTQFSTGTPEKRNIDLIQRDYDQEVKLPPEFVQEFTRQASITETLWQKSKAGGNFVQVQPEFEKLVNLIKKKAEYIDPSKAPYDVLLDLYEPGLTMQQVDHYFNPLKDGVIALIKKCQASKVKPNLNAIRVPTTVENQRKMSAWIMNFLGMDLQRTRIDETEHPFTTGHIFDVRITTHYLDNDPMGSVYSVFHEAGHAIYDMNLPTEYAWTRLGDAISMGIHESQSRFCENMVGKNPVFIEYLYPKLKELFPKFKKVPIREIIRAVNAVQPSKIRIYADEVTYNLHIILRYELEKEILAGKVTVSELPGRWNEMMMQYLGQKIESNTEGVMQDIHWYGGDMGYFPDYALGNVYNGQMLIALTKQITDWETQIHQGSFKAIGEWFKTNVHQLGSLYNPADLVKKITGETPDSKYFLQYLNNKFSKIYQFKN